MMLCGGCCAVRPAGAPHLEAGLQHGVWVLRKRLVQQLQRGASVVQLPLLHAVIVVYIVVDEAGAAQQPAGEHWRERHGSERLGGRAGGSSSSSTSRPHKIQPGQCRGQPRQGLHVWRA
jgi:hypothetical protein